MVFVFSSRLAFLGVVLNKTKRLVVFFSKKIGGLRFFRKVEKETKGGRTESMGNLGCAMGTQNAPDPESCAQKKPIQFLIC